MKNVRFPLIAAVVAIPLMVLATSCIITVSFWEGDDSSVQFDWLIDGTDASSTTCAAADASQVRMSVSEIDDSWEWWDDFYWPCSAGVADTGYVFATGSYYFAWQLIDSGNSPISQTDWFMHTLTSGSNDIATIDFVTGTPPVGPTLVFDWTIEEHAFETTLYDSLCTWATGDTTTIQLWVDTDGDEVADDAFNAECEWGAAQIEPATSGYTVGQNIDIAFALIDSADTVWSQSPTWDSVTLVSGENDLGSVDFDLGDYGPLDVTLFWQDKEVDPVDIDCEGPPIIEAMGYLLSYSTGDVADEVDIDTGGMECTTLLSWLETDFDTYELILDGENVTGGYLWGATCIDLVVDDESSNAWGCDVLMTDSP